MATGCLFSAEAEVIVLNTSRPPLGPIVPPILVHWAPDDVFSGVNRLARETSHSPVLNTQLKNKQIFTSTPHPSSWGGA
jgi:hypothetical protein